MLDERLIGIDPRRSRFATYRRLEAVRRIPSSHRRIRLTSLELLGAIGEKIGNSFLTV